MRTIIIIAIALSILSTFACDKQQRGELKVDSIVIREPTCEKSAMKNSYQADSKEINLCDSIVKEILTTSPRYKKLTKRLNRAVERNGGLSFGIRLDGSPNPGHISPWTYSRTYDFTLYEMYTDRKLNTAYFSFDPDIQQLCERDAVNGQLKPIEFDRGLLPKYQALCNSLK